MRACSLLTLCSLLMLTGCVSSTGRPPGSASVASAADERAEAEIIAALAHYGRGLIYELEQGAESEQAFAQYRQALVHDPDNHDLRSRIAVMALRRQDPAYAIDLLTESCRRAPRDFQRRVDLAAAYQAANDPDRAIEQYRRALAREPARTAVYLAVAGLLFGRGRDAEALAFLDEAHRHGEQPALAAAYCYEQAKRFVTLGVPARAIPCLERLADWDRDQRGRFLHLIGELHGAQGNDAEAIRHFRLAVDEDCALPATYIELAIALGRTTPTGQQRVLDRAVQRFPDDAMLQFTIGCVFSERKDYAAAIAAFERVLALTTASATNAPAALSEAFYLQYGAACERAGFKDKAASIFETGIAQHPRGHRVMNYLAYMWAEHGHNLERALDYINRALAEMPDNGAYVDTRGWIYFQQGRHALALAEIGRAHQLMGDDPEILEHLGDIHSALGRPQAAAVQWKKSLAIEPDNPAVADKLRQLGIDLEAAAPSPLPGDK
jgi:tetratricopeptide (TPR) repeat protein